MSRDPPAIQPPDKHPRRSCNHWPCEDFCSHRNRLPKYFSPTVHDDCTSLQVHCCHSWLLRQLHTNHAPGNRTRLDPNSAQRPLSLSDALSSAASWLSWRHSSTQLPFKCFAIFLSRAFCNYYQLRIRSHSSFRAKLQVTSLRLMYMTNSDALCASFVALPSTSSSASRLPCPVTLVHGTRERQHPEVSIRVIN